MAGGKPERLREPDHARPLLNMQKILNNILRGNRKPLKYFTEENKDKMCTLKKKKPNNLHTCSLRREWVERIQEQTEA